MHKNYVTFLSILVITVLSACGSAEPAISAEDIANTAMAAAWISITQTQAALPTATSIPPSFTAEPTFTPPPTLQPIPTLAPATLAAGPTIDPCNQVPPIEPQGTLVTVEFENQSGGSLNLAFGMNTPNDRNECVTYSYTLGNSTVSSTKVLAGCYWGYGWVTAKEPSVAKSGSSLLCLTDPSLIYHVVITKERIEFK